MATATKEKTTGIVVPPFGIEIDAPRNNDVVLQGIPGCRMRSAHKARAGVRTMPMMPDIPGMQLHVNPASRSYTIVDPLHKDVDLCATVQGVLENASEIKTGKTLAGVPPQSGELDVDRMKTLCREMLSLLDTDYAVMKKGPQPSMEDVNDLPGDFLLNPGTLEGWSQPRYEKDLPAWEQRLARMGG